MRNLWAITCHVNPMRYRRRLQNYLAFRRHLKVPLVAVELAYHDDFDLPPDAAEILIRLRSNDVLWQKERLLNVAIPSASAGAAGRMHSDGIEPPVFESQVEVVPQQTMHPRLVRVPSPRVSMIIQIRAPESEPRPLPSRVGMLHPEQTLPEAPTEPSPSSAPGRATGVPRRAGCSASRSPPCSETVIETSRCNRSARGTSSR
jgi:hypothetical protein